MELAINNCLKRKGIFILGSQQQYTEYAGFKVLAAVVMNVTIVWNIAQCKPVCEPTFRRNV
jgi:hypothetical protein